MTKFLKVVRAYWHITFIIFAIFLVLEFIKPGFVHSQINLIAIFLSAIMAWIVAVIFYKS